MTNRKFNRKGFPQAILLVSIIFGILAAGMTYLDWNYFPNHECERNKK